MKRIVYVLGLCLLIGSTGCLKDRDAECKDVSPATEKPTIETYAATASIAAMPHASGLYYEIINPGSGPAPTATSKLYVTYTGKFLDGTVFNPTTTPAEPFYLTQLITGWQIGLPMIQKGGTIKLIVPSSLAYGCRGRGSIPPNTILYFEITLNDVQ